MYLRYYGFQDYPFSATPDPGFLYLSASHRAALAHLLYGAGERGGFVALTGEVGTGKTTLIRALVASEIPDLDVALCWNPRLEVNEFVATVCDELGVDYAPGSDRSLKALVDRLNAHLLASHAAGRRTVLVIDEAQHLSREVLEQLRLLTNLETHMDKLLRVILVGQPELAGLLARHDLRQLAQRITARFTLVPLGRAETRAYVQHRMGRADGPQHLFSPGALAVLHWRTAGVPRLINMVCERALMGGYAHARSVIGPWTAWRAAGETLPKRARRPWLRLALPTGALAAAAAVLVLAWLPNIPPGRAAEKADHDGHAAAAPARGAGAGQVVKSVHKRPRADPPSAAGGRLAKADAAVGQRVAASDEADADSAGGQDRGKTKAPSGDAQKTKATDDGSDRNKKKPKPKKIEKIPKGDADLNQLLRLWGVFGAQVHSSCKSLHVGDLRCLADSGSFATIERYNRPALLSLRRGRHRQVVLLSAIDGDRVTLVGGDGTSQVPRAKLLRLWSGRFRVVWRVNSKLGLIQPGTVGSAVVWLRRHLARAKDDNPDLHLGPQSLVYDQALKVRLERFQRAHGLKPDGLAGPRTQIMLNGAVSSPGSPALTPVKKKNKDKD